jgi:broad specificity phosphatase PhoE
MAVDRMKYLLFVRHGLVDRTRTIYPDEDDIHLSGAGVAGLERLKAHVERFDPQRVVVSSVRRCQESARVLCRDLKCSVTTDPRLRERVFRSLYGKTAHEIAQIHGASFLDLLNRGSENVTLPGEESLSEAADRVVEAVSDALTAECSRILLVSHGGPHSWLCCYLLKHDLGALRHFTLDEAYASLFEFTDSCEFRRLVRMNGVEVG